MKQTLRQDNSAVPLLLATLGLALLTGMDSLVKSVASGQSAVDLVAGRFLFGAAVCLPLLARVPLARIDRSAVRAHGLRTLLVLATSSLFFYALGRLPLFEAIVLTFLSPVFMALLGRIILGERVARGTIAAIAISFVGVAVIAWGQGVGTASATRDAGGVAAAIAAAFTYALSLVLLRARTGIDSLSLIIGLQNLMAALLTVPFALAFGSLGPLVSAHWPVLFGVGLLGTAGHLVYASAFKRAAAAKVGTAEFTSLVWAFLLGWVFFGEVPAGSAVAGAALIVCGSLLLVLLRRQPASL